MTWEEMQSNTLDSRPASNHSARRVGMHWVEEGLVHADDGTMLGKLTTATPILQKVRGLDREGQEGIDAQFPIKTELDVTRDERVRAMRDGSDY